MKAKLWWPKGCCLFANPFETCTAQWARGGAGSAAAYMSATRVPHDMWSLPTDERQAREPCQVNARSFWPRHRPDPTHRQALGWHPLLFLISEGSPHCTCLVSCVHVLFSFVVWVLRTHLDTRLFPFRYVLKALYLSHSLRFILCLTGFGLVSYAQFI